MAEKSAVRYSKRTERDFPFTYKGVNCMATAQKRGESYRGDTKKSDKVYSDYLAYFYNDQVKSFDLDLGTSNLTITLKEELREDRNKDNKLDEKDDIIKYRVPNVSLFLEDVKDYRSLLVKNGNTYDYQPQSQMPWFVNLIPSLLIIVFFVAMFVMMRRSLSSMDGGGKAMGFGKARIKQPVDEKRKTTFADVAGSFMSPRAQTRPKRPYGTGKAEPLTNRERGDIVRDGFGQVSSKPS